MNRSLTAARFFCNKSCPRVILSSHFPIYNRTNESAHIPKLPPRLIQHVIQAIESDFKLQRDSFLWVKQKRREGVVMAVASKNELP